VLPSAGMTWESLALIAVLGVAFGGIVWGMFFSRDSRIHRQLAAAPIQTVAGALQGTTVRLTGRAEPLEEVLLAPLSGRRCVHYRILVEERQYRPQMSDPWIDVHREERSVDFLLRDASGVARVRMSAARVALVVDRNSRSGLLDNPTPQEAALLERLGENPIGPGAMNRTLRYIEGAIELGEEVTVLGVASPGDEHHGLVVEAPPEGHVLVTDEPTTVRLGPR